MSSFQRRFGQLFVLSATGSMLSFGNQLLVSFHFGTSKALDSYWALLALANFLVFYVQPLREALVPPVYSATADDRERACALFSAGLAAQLVLSLGSATLLFLVPTDVLERLGVKTSTSPGLWAAFLTYFILYALAETCNGLLLSFNRVVYQSVARLASAFIGLACLWLLAGRIGLLALVLSLLISQIATLLVSIVGLQKEGIRWVWRGFRPLWKDSRFRSVFFVLLLNYLLAQLYVVCERVTMLGMMPGLVASYQYSASLVNVLISLLAFPLANLLWPRFLVQAHQGGTDVMLHTAVRVVAPLTLTLMACCAFAARFAPEIVQLLFVRGSFDATSAAQTSQALRATVFAAIPISLFTIFTRILFSQGRGRAIAAGGVSIALSGSGVVLLAGWLGSVALAQWHWAIGNTVGLLVVLFILLHRTLHPEQYVRSAFTWLLRACAVILLALAFTPSVVSVSSAWSIATGLTLSLGIFGASVTALASLVRVVDLRQLLGQHR
jgi:peptidoglycan biosynthesis protein MviN/MurJ (putative lipid II flippase)